MHLDNECKTMQTEIMFKSLRDDYDESDVLRENSPRMRMTMKTKTPRNTDLTSMADKSLEKREASGREPDMTARPPSAKLMTRKEPGDDVVPEGALRL